MVLTLPPDIVAVYLQAAIKVFGSWAAELADRWDDADLPKVKAVVDSVTASLSRFASNTDIEVQERVSESSSSNTRSSSSCISFVDDIRRQILSSY